MCVEDGYFFIFFFNDILDENGQVLCKISFVYSIIPKFLFFSQIGLIALENWNGLSQIQTDVTLTSS